jgi:hypothetical protein
MMKIVKDIITAYTVKMTHSVMRLVSYPSKNEAQKERINKKYKIGSGTVSSPAALLDVVISIIALRAGSN